MAEKDKKYKVGYGKPPKETRFKPGQSGNPKGRPKGAKNLSTVVRTELDEKIVITEGGRQRTVTKREALFKALLSTALKGNVKATSAIIQLDQTTEQADAERKLEVLLGEEDEAVLAEFLDRNNPRPVDHDNTPEEGDDSDDPDEA